MREKTGDSVRVLVVGQGPPTTGGIPTFVTGLVNDETLQDDVDLDYLNTTPQGTKRPGSFALSNFTLLARHAVAVFKKGRRADVVHLNLAPAPLLPLLRAIVLVAAAKLARARVILHAHTGRMHIAAESGLYRFALRVALRLVDEMIVVSERAVEATRSAGRAATYLPNGIDFSSIQTGPKEDRPPSLVFVGTVCERKGLLDLRVALSGLQGKEGSLPLTVRILGDACEEGPGVFERVVADYRSHGLDDVEFAGSIDRAEVLETLGRSNIFCLPSHWEGFPLSLLEGMAASCAVVATDVGDVAEMLDGGRAGVVVPLKDPVALQEALEELVADAVRRDELGAAARDRVENHYSQSKLVSELAALYEKWGRYST